MRGLPITEEQAREMYEEHAPYVYGIALMMTKSKAIADDIVQEVFLRAYQKYHLYDPLKPLRPWLFRITMNIIRGTLRKQRWLTWMGQVPETESSQSLEDLVMQNEREEELWMAVNLLSGKRREVVIMHYYTGLSLRETAAVLGILEGTCKSRLHAALKQLRKDSKEHHLFIKVKENVK
ncbi:RNA polymerase sigma-70 factor, ECF subfamily [Paenibacillus sp. 1_12]|uniref:RNA polymerase sigma factor n=1 Tax=Paenibacillus sp. 1_12 TaxID=1566278 RepID=UPI0008EE9CD3|nr:sigma-70 family RNA polymerase sigma factor [Paenibacillus sp. 1_12]SFL67072.1 RNA polymerase sigma-70 factor, ECF subfamily [Paenibacillus sp. 1_12]